MYRLAIFKSRNGEVDIDQKLKSDLKVLQDIAADYAKANRLQGKNGDYSGESRGYDIRTQIDWVEIS